MSISVSLPINTTKFDRHNPTWLKNHQFKKGSSGRPKGLIIKSKFNQFTGSIFGKALLYDPETGKRWKSEEECAIYWARRGGSDGRIQQEIVNRALGKIQEKVDQTVTFIIGTKSHDAIDVEHTDIGTTIELPVIPNDDNSNNDDSNQ